MTKNKTQQRGTRLMKSLSYKEIKWGLMANIVILIIIKVTTGHEPPATLWLISMFIFYFFMDFIPANKEKRNRK